MQALLEGFDPEQVNALMASFVRHETWVTPTLDVSIINTLNLSDPDPADPRRSYLPERMLRTWSDRANDPRTTKRAPISVELRKGYLCRAQELTRMMRSAGVPLLAGSDTGASNPHEYPGFSLHTELARMVEAGLTPMEAIQAATWNSAKWSGRLSSLGSIARGKVADLVLLDANPLDDIRNTVKISAVFTNGRLLERAHLDRLLRSAATGKP